MEPRNNVKGHTGCTRTTAFVPTLDRTWRGRQEGTKTILPQQSLLKDPCNRYQLLNDWLVSPLLVVP